MARRTGSGGYYEPGPFGSAPPAMIASVLRNVRPLYTGSSLEPVPPDRSHRAGEGRAAFVSSVVAVHALGLDHHGNAPFDGHGAVVLVPVIVGAAGRFEDDAQQEAQAFTVHPFERIVWTGELHWTLHCAPLPTCADDDRRTGTAPKVGEPTRSSSGDESHDGSAGDRVTDQAGVHDGRLDGAVGSRCRDDHESMVERNQSRKGM